MLFLGYKKEQYTHWVNEFILIPSPYQCKYSPIHIHTYPRMCTCGQHSKTLQQTATHSNTEHHRNEATNKHSNPPEDSNKSMWYAWDDNRDNKYLDQGQCSRVLKVLTSADKRDCN
jgi:hypothetical protein